MSLLKLFIFNENQKGSDPDGRGAEEGKCNQDILYEKKHIFSIKGKLILSDLLLIIQQFCGEITVNYNFKMTLFNPTLKKLNGV